MSQYRLTSLRLALAMLEPKDPAAPRPKASDVVNAAKSFRKFLTEGQPENGAPVENADDNDA